MKTNLAKIGNNSFDADKVNRFVQEIEKLEDERSLINLSIRDVYKVTRAFYNGADIVTVPPGIFEKMYEHVLTREGLVQFDKDWAEYNG